MLDKNHCYNLYENYCISIIRKSECEKFDPINSTAEDKLNEVFSFLYEEVSEKTIKHEEIKESSNGSHGRMDQIKLLMFVFELASRKYTERFAQQNGMEPGCANMWRSLTGTKEKKDEQSV